MQFTCWNAPNVSYSMLLEKLKLSSISEIANLKSYLLKYLVLTKNKSNTSATIAKIKFYFFKKTASCPFMFILVSRKR